MRSPTIPVNELSGETRQLLDVLNKESDLACVVIGAAFLDTALASLLAQKLLASSVSNKLLASIGALGSYAARADMAYCLSLIRKEHYQDLCAVGEIRNKFAHSHLQLSFRESSIQELCHSLKAWRIILHGEAEQQRGDMTEAELGTSARNEFNLSVVLLANRLLLNALSLKAKPTA